MKPRRNCKSKLECPANCDECGPVPALSFDVFGQKSPSPYLQVAAVDVIMWDLCINLVVTSAHLIHNEKKANSLTIVEYCL
jgi:hypothetical protein